MYVFLLCIFNTGESDIVFYDYIVIMRNCISFKLQEKMKSLIFLSDIML